MINGFTSDDNSYYLITKRHFHHCYTLYGFCSACSILRCSPVWCICGHKELSKGWTSNNESLDKFIRESQKLTKSPNEAYLEWIPFDNLSIAIIGIGRNCDRGYLHNGLPTNEMVNFKPFSIRDRTDNLYQKVNYLIRIWMYLLCVC